MKKFTTTHQKQTYLKNVNVRLWILLGCLIATGAMQAQVVINEIRPNGTVELKNIGSSTIDVGSYWLCDFPVYQQIGSAGSIIECGSTIMAPGSILVVNNFNTIAANDGEMGLYTVNNFASPTAIIDYVEWGSTGHVRSSVAVAAGIWTTGAFVPAFSAAQSLEYSGSGNSPSSWSAQNNPTICAENGDDCTAAGGNLGLMNGMTELSICSSDDISDVFNVILSDNAGSNSAWLVTDEQGNILALPTGPPFDLEDAGEGTCLVWHLSYEDGLTGVQVGMNAANLQGCFDLSNPITVTKNSANGGQIAFADGSTQLTICTVGNFGDPFEVVLSGQMGSNSAWVITDEQGLILELPIGPPFDPGIVEESTYQIWHLSYEDGLTGAGIGMNAADLQGCFALSNPITVMTTSVEAGSLSTENETIFCLVDDILDIVEVETTGTGDHYDYILTDDSGNVMEGLVNSPIFDFSFSEPGTCRIYGVAYSGDLTLGATIDALTGDCFSLTETWLTIVKLGENEADCIPFSQRENTAAISFQIAPNPAKTTYTITVEGLTSGEGSLNLVDIHGKTIEQHVIDQSDLTIHLNASKLDAGIYFLRLENQGGVSAKRLIVHK
ncbi:MAG TPA: T9SS type A sorting domain-containing protein [Saprospiraceae bacterium]|nr:T9SS type A sorting domain-containing protein [Saprospiraceae bacterium]HMQ83818.1 T9SS type A sorting domain-containing protein [Saprospiraceae bacterium]